MRLPIDEDLAARYAHHTFAGKRDDETIVLLLRRHWLILVVKLIPLVLMLFVLIGLHFAGPSVFALARIRGGSDLFMLAETFMWMMFWIILFVIWVDYYLDVWIVTDHRIINVEQLGLFRRQISELDHEKIQDVTSEVQGVIPTLFNFGNVFIQSAAERERFLFKQVPNPVQVRNVIMELQQWVITRERKEESDILRDTLQGKEG